MKVICTGCGKEMTWGAFGTPWFDEPQEMDDGTVLCGDCVEQRRQDRIWQETDAILAMAREG